MGDGAEGDGPPEDRTVGGAEGHGAMKENDVRTVASISGHGGGLGAWHPVLFALDQYSRICAKQ